jgi:hypothetical protein
MRVGKLFEEWACTHVAFPHLNDVWSYFLEQFFGESCLRVIEADSLARFGSRECLLLTFDLEIPVWGDTELPVPFQKMIFNPVNVSPFESFLVQTARMSFTTMTMIPFRVGDNPFDENLGKRVFGIYGVERSGKIENITYRDSFREACDLLLKLAPGTLLEDRAFCHASPQTAGDTHLRRNWELSQTDVRSLIFSVMR